MTTYRTLRDALNHAGDVIQQAEEDIARTDRLMVAVERRREDRRASTFVCPTCGHELSRVTDSRGVISNGSVRRRRECIACETRFTTIERIVLGTIQTKSA